jgi:hypothetical protein
MSEPLFVFGVARSGTNLLAGMLNAHSAVALALDPLLPFFKSLRDAWVERSGSDALRERYPHGSAFQDYYFQEYGVALLDTVLRGELDVPVSQGDLASRIAARASLESPELAGQLQGLSGGTHRELLDDLLARVSSGTGSDLRWCGTKEVWTAEFIPSLARAYPTARFIIIRRDPRAILASLRAMVRKDPTQAAHEVSYLRHWRKEMAVLEELQSRADLRERIHCVRYEGMSQRPHEELQRLVRFLDIEIEPSMLEPGANSSYGAMRGVSTTSVARWKETLDSPSVRAIEYHCAPEMIAEGFTLQFPVAAATHAELGEFARNADAHPGSWRSDSGDVQADLQSEAARWRLLTQESSRGNREPVRRHFLFETSFARLGEAVARARRET